jgi:hypothetical protein
VQILSRPGNRVRGAGDGLRQARVWDTDLGRHALQYMARGDLVPDQLWEITGAGHTGGISAAPAEYERRVMGFFDRALLPGTRRPRAAEPPDSEK